MSAKKILVADDMELVLTLCKLALEARGYDVIPAEDGLSAVELYRNRAREIALSLIDFRMPGMAGIEVARAILDIDPNAKIALMTGGDTYFALPDDLEGRCEVLGKPFTIAALRELVDRILKPAAHQTMPNSTA